MKRDVPLRLPGETLKSLLSRIPKSDLTAFLSAFFAGVITHFYMLVNKLPGRDEIPGMFTSRDRATSGRFLLGLFRRLWTDFSMPFVNGLAAIVCIAIIAALCCHMLRIKKPVYAALAGISLAVFPTVGNFLTYMYTVDAVMLGLLLGVLGAFLLDLGAGEKRGWRLVPPCALLMAFSLGVYQANICFVTALLATRGLLLLVDEGTDGRSVRTAFFQFVSALALSAILYTLLSKSVLAATGRELDSYQGLSEAGFPSPARLMHLIKRAYVNFAEFLFITAPRDTTPAMLLINAALAAAAVLGVLNLLLFSRLSGLRRGFSVLLALLLPLAYTCIYLFDPALVHILMLYSVSFFYVLPIALLCCEPPAGTPAPAAHCRTLLSYIVCCCLLFSGYSYFLYTNQGYLSLQLKYENCYSLAERITDRVERHPDYVPGGSIAFIGSPADGNYPPDKSEYLDPFHSGVGFGNDDNYWYIDDDKHFKYFVKYYIGVNFAFLDDGLLSNLESDPAVSAMPCYPAEGCIREVSGTLVVKLANEEE